MTDHKPRYLIATDDGTNPDYTVAREAGIRRARDDGAAVVLYDRTSESALTDPYPVGPWSDEDDAVSAESHLEPDVLHNLGRGYLAEQLAAAREAGVEAEAYLAQGTGADALDRAVERFRPDLVVLPTSVADDSLLDRFERSRLVDFTDKVDAEVCLIDADGSLREP